MKLSTFAFLGASIAALPATAENFAVEVYGGVPASGTEIWGSFPYFVDSGTAIGFGAYKTGISGFELGVDVMQTRRKYTFYPNHNKSLSVMAVARYPFDVSGNLQGYIGVGLGAIRGTYQGTGPDAPSSGSGIAFGGQLSLGMRYAFSEASSVFAEAKYQSAFNHPSIDPISGSDFDQSYRTRSLLLGYRHGF